MGATEKAITVIATIFAPVAMLVVTGVFFNYFTAKSDRRRYQICKLCSILSIWMGMMVLLYVPIDVMNANIQAGLGYSWYYQV
jgi:ABC-type lipoprotein release transport system permease subunit